MSNLDPANRDQPVSCPSVLRPRLSIAAAVLGLLVAAAPASALEEQSGSGAAAVPPGIDFSPNRLIVEWAPGASQTIRETARDEADVLSVKQLGSPLFQLVRLDEGQDIVDALASLREEPGVQAVARDEYSTLHSIPDDPEFSKLWGLQNLGGVGVDSFSGAIASADVNAPLAWDRTIGLPSIVIADLDTGYRFDSPDLGPVAWENTADPPGGGDNDLNGIVDDSHGADFVGPSANSPTTDGDPTDDNLIDGGHGVHTAGTMGAAGDDGVGITGVAQDVRIMPLRVCGYYTDPTPTPVDESGTVCPVSSQIMAINYAGSHGARVANMSLGGTTFNSTARDAFAKNPGTLFVISAGNDGQNNEAVHHYPCDYEPVTSGIVGAVDNVVCVAATDQADDLADFSDWGSVSVDLGAPGTEILSTYPAKLNPIDDTFEANDFSSRWTSGGAGFGRAASGDGPLTSFGMTDSPGAAPAASSVHEVTLTTGAVVPAGAGACALSGKRYRFGGSGGTFFYKVLSDDVPVFTNTASTTTSSFAMEPFNTVPIKGLGGHAVKFRFGFTAGPSPTASNGIWFDDLKLSCYAPLSTPPGYTFLQGTSMAAPHVTGAAGLLFSLKPAATVTEVRSALLAGVDAIPALTGKTTTGGRLDIPKALDKLEGKSVDSIAPAKPILPDPVPGSGTNDNNPKIKGSAEAGTTVTLFKGFSCTGKPIATGTAAELEDPGIGVSVSDNSLTVFTAAATDVARNRSSCSTATSYLEQTPPPEEGGGSGGGGGAGGGAALPPPSAPILSPPPLLVCKVPKLAGLSLAKAKSALVGASCVLGKVTQPKPRKGHKLGALVVKSSSPAAGATASGVVNLTLGPKPKKPHH